MTDFLLELRSEEIPARMQDRAREDLTRLFVVEIGKAGLVAESIATYATPRRLALIARGLPAQTAAIREEAKGPRTSAPAQALEGFLRKTGLSAEQLEDRGGVWFATIDRPGRSTADVLAEAIPAIVRAFPWPKSMRWGEQSRSTEALRWVRPLQGIVAILGEELVPCAIDGISSGYATKGHCFHHSGDITMGGAHDYAAKLRACHVIVDQDERRSIIRETCIALAHTHRMEWIADETLVAENAGLTEWPVPLRGDFDPAFLELPPEVIRLTLATNQKYFVCSDAGGKLAPAFICTANIEASDGGAAIVAGNRKVLAARLSDARFFWEQDKRVPLADHAKKLERITFHEKLGTVADKVERVAKLARWLVEEGIVGNSAPAQAGAVAGLELRQPTLRPAPEHNSNLADLAEQAARLCKADLVTEMVGEFPELQGVMGGYYARAEGLPDAVADAIRDHYKPVGQGDDVPTAPVTVAVSLADKLDTLVGFFAIDERPTGSKDPYALRRAALAAVSIIVTNELRFRFRRALGEAYFAFASQLFDRGDVIDYDFDGMAYRLSKNEHRRRDTRFAVLKAESPSATWLDDDKWAFVSDKPLRSHVDTVIESVSSVIEKLGDYLFDRFEEGQRRQGATHDVVRSVLGKSSVSLDLSGIIDEFIDLTALSLRVHQWENDDDFVRLLARIDALQAFVGGVDGANLLAGYKRAANILKKEGWTSRTSAEAGVHLEDLPDSAARSETSGDGLRPSPEHYEAEPAEAALIAALDAAEPRSAAAVEAERFEEAMAALASLRAPIDAFFDSVTVNDADPAKRAARLALLARFTAAVNGIADFSKIEG